MDETLKKEEGKDEGVSSVDFSHSETFQASEDGQTVEEISLQEKKDKQIKNLLSFSILLVGLFVGSLFIDFIQLFLGSGYSERALKKAEIFSSGDKTWVAFSEPIVEAKVLALSDEELDSCPECDPQEVLVWLKKFLPTLIVKKVAVDSAEGQTLIKDFGLKSVPAFIFDKTVKETDFFSQTGVDSIFEEKNEQLVLNKTLMGIPNGKFLVFPEISDKDSVWGNKEGLKLIVFSDFQCPYSKNLFLSLEKMMKEGYQEKLSVVFKNLPAAEIHPLAEQSASVAICAQEQGKFWEAAKVLFARQDQWGVSKNPEIFKNYYREIGLDGKIMGECLATDRAKEKLAADAREAEEFSLVGTPAGFIGERVFGGAIEAEDLKSALEEQLSNQ